MLSKDLINQDATVITESFIADRKASDLAAKKVRTRQVDEKGRSHGVGKYKTAVARAFLCGGPAELKVNGKDAKDYFKRTLYYKDIQKPFVVTDTENKITVYSTVAGGGLTAQSRALRLAIAIALERYNPSFYDALREHELTTFINRPKEREKPGQKGARAKKPTSRR